jgi:hypothetical protein
MIQQVLEQELAFDHGGFGDDQRFQGRPASQRVQDDVEDGSVGAGTLVADQRSPMTDGFRGAASTPKVVDWAPVRNPEMRLFGIPEAPESQLLHGRGAGDEAAVRYCVADEKVSVR